MPRVTRNLDEFFKWSRSKPKKVPKRVYGYYARGVIWTREATFRNILHEFIHYILRIPWDKKLNVGASIILFFDFLIEVHDFVNGMLFHKPWRKQVHKCFREYVLVSFSDWLDWVLCR